MLDFVDLFFCRFGALRLRRINNGDVAPLRAVKGGMKLTCTNKNTRQAYLLNFLLQELRMADEPHNEHGHCESQHTSLSSVVPETSAFDWLTT